MGKPRYWTTEKIIESFENFIENEHKFPKKRDLDLLRNLPCRPTILSVTGLSFTEFVNKYFPSFYDDRICNKYKHYSKEYLVNNFKKQYIDMGYPTQEYYNSHREDGTPRGIYIAKICGFETWNELLEFCKFDIIQTNSKSRVKKVHKSPKFDVKMEIDYSHTEQIKKITEAIDAICKKVESRL